MPYSSTLASLTGELPRDNRGFGLWGTLNPRLTPAIGPHSTKWRIKRGFVPNMNVDGVFYVNAELQALVFSELEQFCRANARQGFLPALKIYTEYRS